MKLKDLTITQTSDIIKEYQNGSTLTKIGIAHNTNANTIYRLLKKVNVPRRSRGKLFTKEQFDKRIAQLKEGYSYSEIARAEGVSRQNIQQWAINNDVVKYYNPIKFKTN